METTLNTCPSAEQTIAGYIDGNLSTDDRISFERHMASCQVCRTIEHELRMTQSLLRTLPSVARIGARSWPQPRPQAACVPWKPQTRPSRPFGTWA